MDCHVSRILMSALLGAAASFAEAEPPTPGNILVTSQNQICEYTPDGLLVSCIEVPYPGGRPGTEVCRDLVIDRDGKINVFNGTFEPYLSVLDPNTGVWSHYTEATWSIVNNVSYGGIATYGSFVYVVDQTLEGTGGGVRFDIDDAYSALTFGDTSTDYIDISVGLDGRMYGVRASEVQVDVLDPIHLGVQATIFVGAPVRAVTVNADGRIFGANWDGYLYAFEQDGSVSDSINLSLPWLVDIDVSAEGSIVASSGFGDVIVTDELFNAPSTFIVGFQTAFVALVPECLTLIAPTLRAGEPVEIVITDGTPTKPVIVRYAFRSGPPVTGQIGPFCADTELRPFVGSGFVGTGEIDAGGRLVFPVSVPAIPGLTLYLQAFEAGSCPDSCNSPLLRRTIE